MKPIRHVNYALQTLHTAAPCSYYFLHHNHLCPAPHKDQGVIGGADNDNFSSMALTKDGGLIVGGTSYSDSGFQKTENSKGYSDYWVVKLDSNKHIQWDKTIGGSSFDDLRVIQQTTDGGYILGALPNRALVVIKQGTAKALMIIG